MKKGFLIIRSFALSIICVGALQSSPVRADDVLQNPYVQLYVHRLEMAKIEVEKILKQMVYDRDELAMYEQLYSRAAASLTEVRKARLAYAMDELILKDLQAKVQEANDMVEIARTRIGAGQDMPICTISR